MPCLEFGSTVSPPSVGENKATIAPGDASEQITDINEFHADVRQLHEGFLHDTADQLGVTLIRNLQPCAGCPMGKGYRKALRSTTTSRATRKLERAFIDLSEKKAVAGIGGVKHAIIIATT